MGAFSFEGKKKSFTTEADEFIKHVLQGESEDGLLFYSEGNQQKDDSWEKFPDVGVALQDRVPEAKENFCIVTMPSHGVWAVGVQDKGIARYYACRVALAISLASQLMD